MLICEKPCTGVHKSSLIKWKESSYESTMKILSIPIFYIIIFDVIPLNMSWKCESSVKKWD